MIRAEDIVKSFKSGDSEITVLKGISLTINEGEFVSIIGRSGSGKTTFLYQLGLLDHPTSGKVFFQDAEVTNMSERERTLIRLNYLGYVFQDYALVAELNAIENVMIPLLMLGMSKSEARKKSETALDRVGLQKKLRNLPSQLSGGEQQRVSIARAIANHPKVLFADEPTANLDNDTSLTILKVFQELHAEGQTIVMVTHELEYTNVSDRVVTLFDGKITKEERPKK